MKKTHPKSRIVQFHHSSTRASKLLDCDNGSSEIVLQLEEVQHSKFDFIAEIINKSDYNVVEKVEEVRI
jgi:hypothetical protein